MAQKKVGVVEQIVAKVRDLLGPIAGQISVLRGDVANLGSRVEHVEQVVGDVKERVQKIPVPAPQYKLCKDCRFCVPYSGAGSLKWSLAKCGRPNPSSPEWLTGGGDDGPFCVNERADHKEFCGLAGKYWEAK